MIRVVVGDLAGTEGVEAVVRPVRSDGEAVSAAGRRVELAAGPGVAQRLQALGELPVGGAVITPGGGLPASFLIHAVVQSAEEAVSRLGVQRALVNAVRRAQDWGVTSLAVPPIGTGAGNLDVEEAAEILVEVLQDHLRDGADPRELTIVVEGAYEEDVYARALADVAAE